MPAGEESRGIFLTTIDSRKRGEFKYTYVDRTLYKMMTSYVCCRAEFYCNSSRIVKSFLYAKRNPRQMLSPYLYYVSVIFKEYYETKPEERDLTQMEKALRRYLLSEQDTSKVRSSVCNLLVGTDDKRSSEERELRRALSKIVRVGDVGSQTTKLVFMKPRTLKAFLEDEDTDRRLIDFKCLKVSFALFSDKDK